MQMMPGVLSVAAAAALVDLDAVQFGQFTFARPTVAGALLGVLGGDFMTGLQLGVAMELMNLDQVPVGGYVPPDGTIGAACAFGLCRYFGFAGGYAFFIGFALAKMFSPIEMKMRAHRSLWNAPVTAQVVKDPGALGGWILKGMVQQFAVCLIFMLSAVYAAGNIGGVFWALLPQKLHAAFFISYRLVPWIGLTALAYQLYPRKGT